MSTHDAQHRRYVRAILAVNDEAALPFVDAGVYAASVQSSCKLLRFLAAFRDDLQMIGLGRIADAASQQKRAPDACPPVFLLRLVRFRLISLNSKPFLQ